MKRSSLRRCSGLLRGAKYYLSGCDPKLYKPSTVMAVADGWVMMRAGRCDPFTISVEDLNRYWTPAHPVES